MNFVRDCTEIKLIILIEKAQFRRIIAKVGHESKSREVNNSVGFLLLV